MTKRRPGRSRPALAAVLLVGVATTADANPSHQAQGALERLRAEASALRVVWPAGRARPAGLSGLALERPGRTLEQRARQLLDELRPLVLGGPQETVALTGKRTTRSRQVLRFEQRYRGLPVFGRQITVAFDRAGRIHAVHSDAVPIRPTAAATEPRLTPAAATLAAYSHLSRITRPSTATRRQLDGLGPRLVLLADGGPARLAYAVVLPFRFDPRGRVHLIDARDGRYLGWRPGVLSGGRPPQRQAEVRR